MVEAYVVFVVAYVFGISLTVMAIKALIWTGYCKCETTLHKLLVCAAVLVPPFALLGLVCREIMCAIVEAFKMFLTEPEPIAV